MKRPTHRKSQPVVFTDRKPASTKGARIVSRSSADRLLRVGLRANWRSDLYYRSLTLNWWQFILMSALVYLAANVIFAGLYLIQPGSILNARPGSFADAFFFSVETFATVGYGVLSPATTYANWVMTLETLVGLMMVALTTGLLFARVSRPTARVLFSEVAVIGQHNGQPCLMIRLGNQRLSQIVDARVSVTILRNEITTEGRFIRRFHDLKLLRERTPVFALSFTAMHIIDKSSPLFGLDAAEMARSEVEVLVTVTGLDETMGQVVHARSSYTADEIRFGHRYADVFGSTADGRRAIDYRRFHDTVAE